VGEESRVTGKMERLQARVREMEAVASGDALNESWQNTWAFQARRELRRRRRRMQGARAARQAQPPSSAQPSI
jgi:hypothetical protein